MAIEVKICGLRTTETLDAALGAGAHYVGLVFHEKSPRNLNLDDGARLAQRAHGKAKIVALVVDAEDLMIDAIMERIAPDFLQLHGNETPERVRAIRTRTGCGVIKAIAVETASDARMALDYASCAELILFDAKAPKGAALPGGNGLSFDWNALDQVKNRVAFMLSGGLTTANVTTAIRQTGATRVDVSSGVESAPGIKDIALIAKFIAAAEVGTG